MSIASVLLKMYKKLNILLKIILSPLLIVIFVLWIIGSLAHFNTLLMFLFGSIVSFVLLYIYGEPVFQFIDKIIEILKDVCSSLA